MPQDAPQFRGDRVARTGGVRRLLVEDRRHGFRGRLALESPPPGHHLVQHAAEREEVATGVNRLAAHLFRCHVAGRAQDRAGVRRGRDVRPGFIPLVGKPRDPGQAEVEDFHPAVGRQEEVLRLDVAVDDALGVGGGEPFRDRRADGDRLPPRQRPPGQTLAERLAFQQFHDGIGDGALGAVVVDAQDVRVGQRRHRPGLALEARPPLGVAREGLRQDFDGDLAPQARVAGAVHLPHAARAERGEDLVRTEPAGDCEHAKKLLPLPPGVCFHSARRTTKLSGRGRGRLTPGSSRSGRGPLQ